MENIEILKSVLSEETYKAVQDETKDSDIKLADLSKGGYVDVKKYNDIKTQLTDKTKQYDELKTAAKENEDLKNQITELEEKHKTELANRDAAQAAKVKELQIKAQLKDWGVYDVNDVYGKLKQDDIGYDDDGNLTGVNEQKDTIKETYAHYFKDDSGNQGTGFEHGDGDSGNDDFLSGFDD